MRFHDLCNAEHKNIQLAMLTMFTSQQLNVLIHRIAQVVETHKSVADLLANKLVILIGDLYQLPSRTLALFYNYNCNNNNYTSKSLLLNMNYFFSCD